MVLIIVSELVTSAIELTEIGFKVDVDWNENEQTRNSRWLRSDFPRRNLVYTVWKNEAVIPFTECRSMGYTFVGFKNCWFRVGIQNHIWNHSADLVLDEGCSNVREFLRRLKIYSIEKRKNLEISYVRYLMYIPNVICTGVK